MPFIKPHVVVKEIDSKYWQLIEPIRYKAKHQEFIVPKGFKTDFATVPPIFTWLIPTYGLYTKAAILHDYLCKKKIISRADADGIFRRTMRELGVSFIRRWMMWAAVRADSLLKGASIGEIIIWLLIAIPSLIFLAIPSLVVFIWLAMFWVLEYIIFGTLKPLSRKRVNKPRFFMSQSQKKL